MARASRHPRLLTGPVNKSSADARDRYVADRHPGLDRELVERAASGEDAFDAAVSALVMAEHLDELAGLPPATDRQTALEGAIWQPGRSAADSRAPGVSQATVLSGVIWRVRGLTTTRERTIVVALD